MSNNGPDFKLPKKIESLLATLSKIYAKDGKTALQEILVNATVRVDESCDAWEDWGEERNGHAICLTIPEALYIKVSKTRQEIQSQIREDINDLHNFKDETISQVLLEFDGAKDPDWRSKSGLLLNGKRYVLPAAEKRIWGENGYRLFLSHKSTVKSQVAQLKDDLGFYGISCFVAHKDIHPTKEWQLEIENALCSMDALAALLVSDFHDSEWTDQEVGFAFGRNIQIVPVKLGKDPYGFIGKYQAITCAWDTAATEIIKILIKQEKMMDIFVHRAKGCSSFDSGNLLAKALPGIEQLTPKQEKGLIEAFNSNDELAGSFGFNGGKPQLYGRGLIHHLSRATGKKYSRTATGKISTR